MRQIQAEPAGRGGDRSVAHSVARPRSRALPAQRRRPRGTCRSCSSTASRRRSRRPRQFVARCDLHDVGTHQDRTAEGDRQAAEESRSSPITTPCGQADGREARRQTRVQGGAARLRRRASPTRLKPWPAEGDVHGASRSRRGHLSSASPRPLAELQAHLLALRGVGESPDAVAGLAEEGVGREVRPRRQHRARDRPRAPAGWISRCARSTTPGPASLSSAAKSNLLPSFFATDVKFLPTVSESAPSKAPWDCCLRSAVT